MNSINDVLARMSSLEMRFQKMFPSRQRLINTTVSPGTEKESIEKSLNSNVPAEKNSDFALQLRNAQLSSTRAVNTLFDTGTSSTLNGTGAALGMDDAFFSKLAAQGATESLARINALKGTADAESKNSSTQLKPTSQAEMGVLLKEAAKKYNLPAALLKAVAKIESNFNEKAVSHKGAMGVMQIMPYTAKDLQLKSPFIASENIDAGAKLLRQLMNTYQGDIAKALAAYNAGEKAVTDKGVPNYDETQNYVKKVMQKYLEFSGVKK